MNSGKLKVAVVAVRNAFDRRTVGGVVIGAAVMLSAMATAQTSSSGWFSGLFSTGGASSGSSSTALISQQDSVVAASINAEAADCAQGKPGTIGEAMQAAMAVHQQIASATPQVESLFDAGGSCFNGQIFDLSFAIPSLASMLSAVESAVLKYAQKKVCTAVNRVTGMVTTPINQSITSINQMTNVSGILNNAVGGAMTQIDPSLGSQYHPTVPDGTYTVGTNPFNAGNTTFDTSAGGSTGGSVSSTLSGYSSQISSLTQQVANQQVKVNQGTLVVQDAQSAYSSCANTGGDCTPQFNALQGAQQSLANSQSTLISQQQQITQVVPAGAGTVASGTTQTQPASANPAPSTTQPASTSWWSSIGGIFK